MNKMSLNLSSWEMNNLEEYDDYEDLTKKLPEIVVRVLLSRGITKESLDEFLNPRLSRHLPSPFNLKDMEKGALRLAKAISDKEKIFIFGDYDVDGATSSGVLGLFLRYFGIDYEVKIPERDEGYGPNTEMLPEIKDKGYSLVFTVDCGTTSFEMLDKSKELGLDVIIADHHQVAPTFPQSYAFINPKRLDEPANNPYYNMAAVGVVFLLVIATNTKLREMGFYNENLKEPDVRHLLELVALGTICDMVSLTGINRTLVKHGLNYFGSNIGLKELSKNLIKNEIRSYHMGFILGPRINAAGRVGVSSLGFRLLNSKTEEEASKIVEELESLNSLRRDIEAEVLEEAVKEIEKTIKPEDKVILVGSKNWHQGVIGIVAGKLRERYGLTTLVMSYGDDGIAKGSGRANESIDLGFAITKASEIGIVEKGGGHLKAAGFSVAFEKIPELKAFLEEIISKDEVEIQKTIGIDAVLDISAVNVELADALSALEPYGEGNSEPLFLIKQVVLHYFNIYKESLMVASLKDMAGNRINAKLFKQSNYNLFEELQKMKGSLIDVVGYVKASEYKGKRNVEFMLVDVKI
ncbi:MAG: Single-stranded-DNA-specific exonuclease RecJ [Alphaproteobacteria bacterium ADurb.Bin438]|nr:MAG: Single-stranded-DNA-specific exonuclease RecJ [Alphaproteobacteria bacterium ADurb.Bin438]